MSMINKGKPAKWYALRTLPGLMSAIYCSQGNKTDCFYQNNGNKEIFNSEVMPFSHPVVGQMSEWKNKC